MTILFWVSIAVLVHSYAGYPLSLVLLRWLLGDRSRHRTGDDLPGITLVISAYNEEKVIRQKIENCLALDYPPNRFECIVISDGSSDATDAIVRAYQGQGVRLESFEGRSGKVACLNRVLPGLTSDLVAMSDANSMYAPDSLRRLARHFADPRIGCVCGRLTYLNQRGLASGEGERLYWSYEGWVKILESRLGSLLGANGAIYAYRTRLFREVDPLMFCDDVIPIRIALAGYLTIYDPNASCTEEAAEESVEIRRRRRHASFGLRSMLRMMREALRQGRLLVAYQCLSHRVLRWAGGLALAGLLISGISLPPPWGSFLLFGQGLFYGAALLGFVMSRLGLRVVWLYMPYYFLVITAAGLRGLAMSVLLLDTPYWEPRR